MKILYIAPENTVGTLSAWKKIHETRGNECTFITLYRSAGKFDEGICLDLPLVWANPLYMGMRHRYYKKVRGPLGDYQEKEGNPPVWKPSNLAESIYFKIRDWVWSLKIEPAIRKYGLLEYDIVHLEWGLEFYRDGRFIRRLQEKKIPVVCTYHGQDLRTRGVISEVDEYSSLNLTSEVDLLSKHPGLKYMFLPFETEEYSEINPARKPVRVCHAPTDRYYKGSESIIPVCEKLEKEGIIEFVLIENKPFHEARRLKADCDILIDQVHDRGGWGYGMNSVEAMAMGLVCATELNETYRSFIPNHPFISITGDTLYDAIKSIAQDSKKLQEMKTYALNWVKDHHSYQSVGTALYGYYKEHLNIE